MAFDFKKECKELYKPASKPSIVTVPPFNLRAGFSFNKRHHPVTDM